MPFTPSPLFLDNWHQKISDLSTGIDSDERLYLFRKLLVVALCQQKQTGKHPLSAQLLSWEVGAVFATLKCVLAVFFVPSNPVLKLEGTR